MGNVELLDFWDLINYSPTDHSGNPKKIISEISRDGVCKILVN